MNSLSPKKAQKPPRGAPLDLNEPGTPPDFPTQSLEAVSNPSGSQNAHGSEPESRPAP